jgi:CBS domain-containing protein
LRQDRRRAADLMTKEVVTATEDTPVDRIADILQSHRVKRVPIVKDGKVVGVVSRADVIRAMARTPAEMSRSH